MRIWLDADVTLRSCEGACANITSYAYQCYFLHILPESVQQFLFPLPPSSHSDRLLMIACGSVSKCEQQVTDCLSTSRTLTHASDAAYLIEGTSELRRYVTFSHDTINPGYPHRSFNYLSVDSYYSLCDDNE